MFFYVNNTNVPAAMYTTKFLGDLSDCYWFVPADIATMSKEFD